MKKPTREERERMCTRKRRYRTEADALDAALLAGVERRRKAYRCLVCGQWQPDLDVKMSVREGLNGATLVIFMESGCLSFLWRHGISGRATFVAPLDHCRWHILAFLGVAPQANPYRTMQKPILTAAVLAATFLTGGL